MVLPILVPRIVPATPQKPPRMPSRMPPSMPMVKILWRRRRSCDGLIGPCPPLPSEMPVQSLPSAVQSAIGPREELIRLWQAALPQCAELCASARRCAETPPGLGSLPASQASDPLLRSAERLMRRSLRLSRSKLARDDAAVIREVGHGFDTANPVVRLTPAQVAGAAWLLASMYWCGCRHPAALRIKPLHPPTGLVRWLSTFDVRHQVQVDGAGEILRELVHEMERIDRESRRLVGAMLSIQQEVALLPEFLAQALLNPRSRPHA